jgi:hypothetical protein
MHAMRASLVIACVAAGVAAWDQRVDLDLASDVCTIERVADLTMQEFLERFDGKQPCAPGPPQHPVRRMHILSSPAPVSPVPMVTRVVPHW